MLMILKAIDAKPISQNPGDQTTGLFFYSFLIRICLIWIKIVIDSKKFVSSDMILRTRRIPHQHVAQASPREARYNMLKKHILLFFYLTSFFFRSFPTFFRRGSVVLVDDDTNSDDDDEFCN